nr:preprotein translocase subunit SecE [Sphingomonas sp. ID1715]
MARTGAFTRKTDKTVAKIGNIPQFVQQVRAETAKVVWPTGRETMMTAVMVIIMTSLLGIFFFGIDSVFSAIVKMLLNLAA